MIFLELVQMQPDQSGRMDRPPRRSSGFGSGVSYSPTFSGQVGVQWKIAPQPPSSQATISQLAVEACLARHGRIQLFSTFNLSVNKASWPLS